MADRTKNYALVLPDGEEFYDVEIFNRNFEKLDEATGGKVEKNSNITKGTHTKISYDEKGLVVGGEDLTPDDIPNLHVSKIEGRPPIVYIDGIPIYGSRFFDVDENGNAILRENGNGDYLLTVLENGELILRDVITQVIDNLESTSAEDALSANQGRILSGFIGKLNSLLTNAKTSLVGAINELFGSLSEHANNSRIHIPIYFTDTEPTDSVYLWFAPYNPNTSENAAILNAVAYNGDETKLHAEVDSETYTIDNTSVSEENGETTVTINT